MDEAAAGHNLFMSLASLLHLRSETTWDDSLEKRKSIMRDDAVIRDVVHIKHNTYRLNFCCVEIILVLTVLPLLLSGLVRVLNEFYLSLIDGLTDCEDPECCESSYCKRSQLCTTVDKPINILLQRQPPAPTASFFQKMRFIIEEGSLQRYAENTAFNER